MDKTQVLENLKRILSISSQTGDIDGFNKVIEEIKLQTKDLPLEWGSIGKDVLAPLVIVNSKEQIDGEPKILLSGHIDTVFEDFGIKEDEEKIYASGTQDMKGGISVIIETLKNLHKENMLKNITVIFSPYEEMGPKNHYRPELTQMAKQFDYAIVYESTLENYQSHSENTRSIVVSRKGFTQFSLKITGPGGHSGVKDQKVDRNSTINKAAEIIGRFEKLANYDKRTVINPGLIKGGKAFNVLAPETEIEFEIRYIDKKDFERMLGEIADIVDEINDEGIYKIEQDFIGLYPSMGNSEKNKELIKIAKEVAEELGIEIIEENRGGGSEANWFQDGNPDLGILDGFGVKGDKEHSKDEYLVKTSVFQAIKYSSEVVKKLLIK